MDNTVSLSFSAVSHIGTACIVNEDRIYANGKFIYENEADYMQVSLDGSDNQFIFAVSENMDTGRYNNGSSISVMEDIRKFHQKTRSSSKDIQIKLDELLECVEQSNNLVYSVSLGENDDRSKKTAFAGLIIDSGCIAAVNLGSSRIYKYDGNNIKLMVNDYRRAERLLKMGIINDEQAEMLSGQHKPTVGDGRSPAKKSEIYQLKEGNVYLLCSNGLTDAVNEDAILDILASNSETDAAANLLVKEALKNQSEDNITAIVLRIDKVGEINTGASSGSMPEKRNPVRLSRFTYAMKKRKLDAARLISTVIVFVIIAAVLFGAYTMWLNLGNRNTKNASASGTSQPTAADNSAASDESQNTTVNENTQDASATDAVNADETTSSGASGNTGTNTATAYTVKKGDSLFLISRKLYGNPNKYRLIMEANNIKDPDKIQVGQVLKIPALK